jgi:hypothetical protein
VAEPLIPELIASTLAFLREDRERGLHFVPVRHHSPACASCVERLIERVRPEVVLIEGPEDLTPLIPLMLHPETVAPFAAYCTFADDRLGGRHGAYYPFADASPELVALRAGRAAGAELAFIDSTYPEMVRASELERGPPKRRIASLLEESYHRESRYLDAIAARFGCRDHDELWDHLFEARPLVETDRFIDDVAAYCAAARAEHDVRAVRLEGNVERESNMARHVRAALRRGAERIVVVTGGFHTAALPRLVREAERATPPRHGDSHGKRAASRGGAKTGGPALPVRDPMNPKPVLMRYSFDQLDALNGYSAGMPSPHYYDRLFALRHAADPLLAAAAEILVQLGRAAPRKGARTVSTAQVTDALGQASRLAALRGRSGPSRNDVLDAVTSCFVKGLMDTEGTIVLAQVRRALAGDRVGVIPKEAGSPPIVDDFHRIASEIGLDVSDVVKREVTLEIYKKELHRRTSRFFHALVFLEVPFAKVVAGPDFALGTDLDRVQEIWSYAWNPSVESALIEQMIDGATIAEACATRLHVALAQAAEGRSSREAVGLLVAACRMGLFEAMDEILEVTREAASKDGSFLSLASALAELVLLSESREPLEAFRLGRLAELVEVVYERACFAIDRIGGVSRLEERAAIEGIGTLRGLVARSARGVDPALFHDALERAVLGHGPVAGAAAGHLFSEGRMTEDALSSHVAGHLGGSAVSAEAKAGFLRGLLMAAREIAWRVPGIVEGITTLIEGLTDGEFHRALPDLRLAFADLTPKETDRVASIVARGGDLGDLIAPDVSEAEALVNAEITARARVILERDHLGAWA